jgi:uncharacterized membrane protein
MASTPDIEPVRMSDGFRERGAQVTRLEAFVDAAFAFAVSLLVIGGNRIPATTGELIDAIKTVPAYGASFLLILLFWQAHARWSRRYGLDDRATQRLSLTLVFLVLIVVYPMRMVFGSLFSFLTAGYLPSSFRTESWRGARVLFVTFAVSFGSLGAVMWGLLRHAWRFREALSLDLHERIQTRIEMTNWLLVVLVSCVSLALALTVPDGGLWIGLSGFVYFSLNIATPLIRRHGARWLAEGSRR